MSIKEELGRSKWISLVIFLILDFLQILFVSLITLNDSTMFIIGYDPSLQNPIVSGSLLVGIAIAQFILIYYFTNNMLNGEDMVQLFPKFIEPEQWQCHYSRDDIVSWTQELANQSEIKVSKIYLMRSPLPNAFTFSLPFIGAVVVLHSNILDFLELGEVKSVIAHELGHIKNRDSLVSIFTRMPSLFVDLVYMYVYIRLGLGVGYALFSIGDMAWVIARLAVLAGFFVFSRFLIFISKMFVQKGSRSAELLADIHAAEITGPSSTVNALIRLGQRMETISALIDEIRWLESLNPERSGSLSTSELTRMMSSYPLDGIDEDNARDRAPQVFLSTKLKHLRDIYRVELSDEQIKSAIEPAIGPLLKARKLSESEKKKLAQDDPKKPSTKKDDDKPKTIDWREVDYDGDRRLSEEEMKDLISMLRENPTKFMFDNEVGMNILMMSHPDFRRRVLSLADAFSL